MNEIIGKVVEELKKDMPDISYIRGMLETVLAMSEVKSVSASIDQTLPTNVGTPMDEGALLDSIAKAGMAGLTPPTGA